MFLCHIIGNLISCMLNLKKQIMKKIVLLFLLGVFSLPGIAQKKPITIEEERTKNRIIFYAVNENLQDIDVVLTVTGTGFKQRGGVERCDQLLRKLK